MEKQAHSSRRRFLKKSAATAGTAVIGAPAILEAQGTGDRIRVGFIGVGNRGSQLLAAFMKNRDMEVAAFCDVYEPYLMRDRSKVHKRFLDDLGARVPQMGETFSKKVDTCKDFRRILDRKDIDAVCIATPDHWHAIQMIAAVESGKDVYVEKPLTISLREGRAMVDAVRRTNRIVQVGLNRRGSTIYRKLAPFVRDGGIGDVTVARAYRISNMYPDGIGKYKPEEPPEGLDWDMWLGPRAMRPFQYNILPYKFRWWKSYSTQMGNWGVHYMDAIRWFMNEEAPKAVTAHGGMYVLDDDRTIPDTMEVTFEMPSGAVIIFGVYEAAGGDGVVGGEVELRGSKATLIAGERGYTVTPATRGQFQTWDSLTEQKTERLDTREDSTENLVRNFLDCVKTREKPWCDIEEGHRSTCFAHLANISLETGARIEWDPVKEEITNNRKANDLLSYEYRKPWKLT